MTVNIGLVTSDALVLGCDSVASTTAYFLDPYAVQWDSDGQGKAVMVDGKFSLKFALDDLRPVVTNAWGSVVKMSEIHPKPSSAVAITAGLAKLKERPIASLADEFLAANAKREVRRASMAVICDDFLKFMRRKYVAHYRGSILPEQLKSGPEFLVGGFGKNDEFPSLYRILVQENKVVPEFINGRTGIAWNGQAGAVERFVRGYDRDVRAGVYKAWGASVLVHGAQTQQAVTGLVNKILESLGVPMPAGISTDLPEFPKVDINWGASELGVDYANLPIQEAVHFVAALVMMQASSARFARGVATVGGRTHIGVVTKAGGLQILNEPILTHRYTGFSDDS